KLCRWGVNQPPICFYGWSKMFKSRYTIIALLLAISFALMCKTVEVEETGSAENGVYVLCYHSFTNFPHEITFPIKQLDLQMKTLKDAGFNFITTEDLIAKRYKGLNNVLITIDDGHGSVYKAYHEVFKRYNIKPLIAIFPMIISRKNYALTWEQITELHKEGCCIAAHGYYHIYTDAISYKRNPDMCRDEVTKSKEMLESKLDFKIDAFVYPYGYHYHEIVKLVEETGYKFGFTIEPGVVFRNDPNINRFEMPRYMITNHNVHQIFKLMFKSINKTYEHNWELSVHHRRKKN
ncbi:MAG: polysaccharide deacetylase family protein, partial [Leptospirales bacterium]|nr:polysaccharide deacetylase family protein [Leptospirales bacterium]